jgi:hypothetical protein
VSIVRRDQAKEEGQGPEALYIVARTMQNTVSLIGMSISASIICISSGVVDYLKELCRYEKLQS